MECKGCGACCEVLFFPVNTREDKIFFKARGAKLVRNVAIIPHRCQHLNEKDECDIYDKRPISCIRFKQGSPACKACLDFEQVKP